MNILLTDEEIEEAKAQAEKDAWAYKPHPRYEKEKVLLQAHLRKLVGLCEESAEWEFLPTTSEGELYLCIPDKIWQALRREARMEVEDE